MSAGCVNRNVGAVAQLKVDLGVSRVVCFGDSDNDLSMFALADESYAPSKAKDEVKAAATAVIRQYIFLLAATIAFAVGKVSDTVFILIVLLLNAVIGTFQEYSAQKSVL